MKSFLTYNYGKRNGWADKLASHNNGVDGKKVPNTPFYEHFIQ